MRPVVVDAATGEVHTIGTRVLEVGRTAGFPRHRLLLRRPRSEQSFQFWIADVPAAAAARRDERDTGVRQPQRRRHGRLPDHRDRSLGGHRESLRDKRDASDPLVQWTSGVREMARLSPCLRSPVYSNRRTFQYQRLER